MNEQEFEWDNEKALKVLMKHGIDFNDMIEIFSTPRYEISSDRNGETRMTAVGRLNGRFFAVIYTMRGDVIRLITARRARKDEERSYHARYPQDSGEGQD